VIDDAYALELYMMAVSVIEAKGAFISVGVTRLKDPPQTLRLVSALVR